tara:strand:- start:719 stop:1258 length:540 start_codon:yes stop_codon:yes gene_type:complete
MTKKITYEQNQFEVYITNKEIKKRIKEIANDLNTDFISDRPIFIGVLNGCIYFMMDLLKEIKFDYEIDFVKIKSYVGMEQHDISSDLLDSTLLKDKNIIIVEDIIDSGNTINFLYEKIMTCNPKSCTVITLLKKQKVKNFDKNKIDYFCFEIKNKFVIGYGLDINNLFRNLKDIYIKNG